MDNGPVNNTDGTQIIVRRQFKKDDGGNDLFILITSNYIFSDKLMADSKIKRQSMYSVQVIKLKQCSYSDGSI